LNTDEIGKYLEEYTYDYFINDALSKVPEGVDTREGSIIFDALAPACYQLAEFTMLLKNVLLETFTQTATEKYLDLRAEEHGIKRIAATKAIAKGRFLKDDGTPAILVEGNRFSSIGDDPVYYSIIQEDEPGYYTLLAERTGSIGNQYIGQLLPVDHFNGLGSAELTEIVIPARDEETDDSLRERILRTQTVVSFGGNVEDYITLVSRIAGVGGCQIYPVWNGGGTVRVVILDNQYGLASQTLINQVQETIDPPDNSQSGYGLAPIGHNVTVAAPTRKNIDVSVHIDADGTKSLDSIKTAVQLALTDYFLTLRKNWSAHNDWYRYSQTVYRSQLVAQLIGIEGVTNVSNLKLNGADSDVSLTFNNTLQEFAYLGAVSYT